eukprot:4168310-Amphidinium_carterae.1
MHGLMWLGRYILASPVTLVSGKQWHRSGSLRKGCWRELHASGTTRQQTPRLGTRKAGLRFFAQFSILCFVCGEIAICHPIAKKGPHVHVIFPRCSRFKSRLLFPEWEHRAGSVVFLQHRACFRRAHSTCVVEDDITDSDTL